MAHTTANHPDTEHSAHLEATEARQGRWGGDVFVVLVVSTVLAAIVLAALWALRIPDFTAAEAQDDALMRAGPPATAELAPARETPADPIAVPAARTDQAAPEG